MESATSLSSSVLLPELIDLFIWNIVAKEYDEPLEWFQRRDLASCGLASKSFYRSSQKYLFATVTLHIKFEYIRGPHFRLTSELDKILSINPMLQEQIHHLVIKYVEESSVAPYRDPYNNLSLDTYLDTSHLDAYYERLRDRPLDTNDDSGEEKLGHMISLLPALRKLTIVGNSYRVSCNEAVLSILGTLSLSCPHLHRLKFSQMFHVPDSFIHQWSRVNDLELDCTDLGAGAGDLISSTFVLNRLSLKHAFETDNWMPLLSDSMFRALKNIDITEQIKANDLFPRIVRFLMPKEAALNIRVISISIDSAEYDVYEYDVLQILYKHDETWSRIDTAWTSPQYRSLIKVSIHISLHFLRPYSSWFRDKETLKLIQNCSSRLLPLVSSSQSIDLEFSVKVHFSNLHFAWDNRRGASDIGV